MNTCARGSQVKQCWYKGGKKKERKRKFIRKEKTQPVKRHKGEKSGHYNFPRLFFGGLPCCDWTPNNSCGWQQGMQFV